MPNILVLLAAYNGAKWIEQQVNTILCQEGVHVTLNISVDLSTDDTYEKCKLLAKQHNNIHVLPYGERFGGAAQNFFRLIKDSDFQNHKYIAFADQDDIWLEDKLSYAITKINENQYDAFSSNVIAFWADGKEMLVKKSYPQKTYDYLFEAAGPGCTYVLTSNTIELFKEFLKQHDSGIKPLQLHDWALYAFCRSYGLKWHIDERPLLYYRQHNANQVGVNAGWKGLLNRLSLVRDDWYSKQVSMLYELLEPQNTSFSLKKTFLIKHFFELRRRPRDAFFLLLLLLLGIFR